MKTLLKVKDLCKTYIVNKQQNNVLRNVNMSIGEGEYTAVMGPSGSGKSTLLYTVSGMDRLTAGEIFFDGRSLSEMKEEAMASLRLTEMGFIFQQMYLLKNLSIYDNIILSAYMANKRSRSEINADDLRNAAPVVPLRQHPRKIIVDAAREDSPEHNPEIDDRPPQSAGQRAEDRAEPRDVQQLNEERLPQRQRNIVHAVGMVDRRRLPFVRRQKPLNNLRVNGEPQNQSRKRDKKRNHKNSPLNPKHKYRAIL